MDDLFASSALPPERKHYDFWSIHAREKLGLPDDWRWYRLEAKGENITVVTGAVCHEVYKAGKHKGQINWAKRDKETDIPVPIRRDEHKAWLLSWECRSGECHVCHGNGQQSVGWSLKDGSKYRTCTRCNGTGASVSDGSPEGVKTGTGLIEDDSAAAKQDALSTLSNPLPKGE
ncbi:hypothetical protein [Microvirga sp. Mcv34]|uniref:hypothetical protein n=1 Tax=Microvirga sp. Mcv34 TaxID=2926016 RepID=UPI0021C8B726|nr:hypothetical protein [Microvirga sp. Mcv34]